MHSHRFADQFLCVPQIMQRNDRQEFLYQLVRNYYMQCERYDLTICSGPAGVDGVMPANNREFVLVNQNARDEFSRALALASHDLRGLRDAMHAYIRSAEFEHDMKMLDRKP